MKYFYFLLLVSFFFIKISSQKKSFSKIDTLLIKKNFKLVSNGYFEEAIILNKSLIKESENLGYKNGKVRAIINLGSLYSVMGKYEESLRNLKWASDLIDGVDDPFLKVKLYGEYGRNYSALGFYEKSNEMLDRAIKISSTLENKEQRSRVGYLYSFKIDNYEYRKNYDSMYLYLKKVYNTRRNPHNSARIAGFFIDKRKNLDSAEYYIHQANDIFSLSPTPDNKAYLLLNEGKLYNEKGEYSKALDVYESALEIIKKNHLENNYSVILKLISQTYKNLGSKNKSNDYLERYTVLNDSLNIVKIRSMDFPVKQILEETEISNSRRRQKKSLYFVIVVISFVGIVLLVLFYINQKMVKKKIRSHLRYKENLILEKDEKIEELNLKVNDSFTELVALAKNNDPSFFLKFNEFYPEFSKRLHHIQPKLQVSELAFCAFIFLHFSTKDIAENTFVTISAVQLRKNRLRKKLNIASDVDLYLWMNEIVYPVKK